MRVRKASTPRTTILMRTSLTNCSFNFRLDFFYETCDDRILYYDLHLYNSKRCLIL